MKDCFRKHLCFILFLTLFSFFASNKLKLFTEKFYTSHDGEGHVIRMEEFHEALLDGQLPVRMAKRINYGLGYPFFNFNYPFIYYLGEGLHLLGFSFVEGFKIVMLLSILVGSLSIYFLTLFYFGRLGGVISAIFYIFAPYRFLNMYVRGDIAESLGLALVPLNLLFLELLVRKTRWGNFLFTFSLILLFTSHNITAMIGFLLINLYFLSKAKEKKNYRVGLVKTYLLSIFTAFMATSFFWLPVLFEIKLTKLVELTEDYKNFFPTLSEIIYSPWGFGSFKHGYFPGKMSSQIGLIHEFVGFLAILILIYKRIKTKKFKRKEKFLFSFVTLSLFSLFLSLSISRVVWEKISLLKLVQFPWRFVGYIVLGLSVVAGYVITTFHHKFTKMLTVFFLTSLVLYANRNHIRVNMYVDYVSPFITQNVYGPSTTSKDEHMPKLAPRIYSFPNPDGDIIPKSAGISERITWRSNYHMFEVNLKEKADFRDNTSYFPGWVAKIDGATTELFHQKDEFGRLRISLTPGKHKVEFFFKDSGYRLLADLVSFLTLSFLGFKISIKLFSQFVR